MNKEDLKKLGIEDDDLIQKIIVEHGKSIEKIKASNSALQTELDGLKGQLKDAGETIEGFKKLDVDSIKAAADDWKAKAEAAEKTAAEQIQALKFEHALDGALTGAKAKNAKAVKALLQADALKLNEADGSILGLKEQLEKIKSENDYLFESDTPTPKIVMGGKPKNVITDPMILSARKAAGLPVEE